MSKRTIREAEYKIICDFCNKELLNNNWRGKEGDFCDLTCRVFKLLRDTYTKVELTDYHKGEYGRFFRSGAEEEIQKLTDNLINNVKLIIKD